MSSQILLESRNCDSKDCNRKDCTSLSKFKNCAHQQVGWSFRPNGGHVLEHVILNSKNDSLYLVCQDCHLEPENILGISTKRRKKIHFPVFDLDNPEHVSRLIPNLKMPVTQVSKNTVLVNSSTENIDFSGLKKVPVETRKVNITRERLKKRKRISTARALLYVCEKKSMEISGEDRKAIYEIIGEERELQAARRQHFRKIKKDSLKMKIIKEEIVYISD